MHAFIGGWSGCILPLARACCHLGCPRHTTILVSFYGRAHFLNPTAPLPQGCGRRARNQCCSGCCVCLCRVSLSGCSAPLPPALTLWCCPLPSAVCRNLPASATIKVIVVGNGRVGKSSMTTRYCKNVFTDTYKKTIGASGAAPGRACAGVGRRTLWSFVFPNAHKCHPIPCGRWSGL